MKLSSFFATSLVTLAVAFAGPIGCAAEASDDAGDEQSSEDDLTAGPSKSKLLGDVIAIKVDDKIVWGMTYFVLRGLFRLMDE